jgi:hypothetical protein
MIFSPITVTAGLLLFYKMHFKIINYLADHPTIGIIGGIKVYFLSMIDLSTMDIIGRVFQNIGYIFGGLLAALTFLSWIYKNVIRRWKE